MNSPVFNAMGGPGDVPTGMLGQFKKFMKEMKGKNPQEEINKLLQSGKVSQQQLNQIQQQAQQMQGMFKGFFK